MRISIACDHAGFELKNALLDPSFSDEGTFSKESVDYPDYAHLVCQKVLNNDADLGILICGTGIGMSISSNRFKGIRAALCHTPEDAFYARAHNHANILCLGGRTLDFATAKNILKIFLETPFEGGRHQRRIDKCDQC